VLQWDLTALNYNVNNSAVTIPSVTRRYQLSGLVGAGAYQNQILWLTNGTVFRNFSISTGQSLGSFSTVAARLTFTGTAAISQMAVCQSSVAVLTQAGLLYIINANNGALYSGWNARTGFTALDQVNDTYILGSAAPVTAVGCDATARSVPGLTLITNSIAHANTGSVMYTYSAYSNLPMMEVWNLSSSSPHVGILGLPATSPALPMLTMGVYGSTQQTFVTFTSDSTVSLYDMAQLSIFVDMQQVGYYSVAVSLSTTMFTISLTNNISASYGNIVTNGRGVLLSMCPLNRVSTMNLGTASSLPCSPYPGNVPSVAYPSGGFACTFSIALRSNLYVACNTASTWSIFQYSIDRGIFLFSFPDAIKDTVVRMAFSPDQTRLYCAYRTGVISVWVVTATAITFSSKCLSNAIGWAFSTFRRFVDCIHSVGRQFDGNFNAFGCCLQ
jgi:hypothetical protein